MIYWNRFISYIFRYHDFDKCENTGFAKVQKCDEHGKIYINLKDRVKGNGAYSVYLYRETLKSEVSSLQEKTGNSDMQKNSMIPILLYMGKLILKNGRGEGTLSFDWENVKESDRPITAWSGIIIKSPAGNSGNVIPDDIFCSSWTDNEVDYSYAFPEQETEEANEIRKMQNEIPKKEYLNNSNFPKDETDADETRVTAAEILATMKNDSRADELINSREKLPLIPNCPGDEKGVITCVKINPNDIGLLNMENWRLGVNSFLTHGFYNYKYLMLGRVEFDGDEDSCYILGVPGEYSSKEKYLANIFGFDRFVPVQETKIKTGSFGYWVVDLK